MRVHRVVHRCRFDVASDLAPISIQDLLKTRDATTLCCEHSTLTISPNLRQSRSPPPRLAVEQLANLTLAGGSDA